MRLGNTSLWTLALVVTLSVFIGCVPAENNTAGGPSPESDGEVANEVEAVEVTTVEETVDPDEAAAPEESAEPVETVEEVSEEGAESTVTGDWQMWGGSIDRNMVNDTSPLNIDFDPED
ncbi:MAG: hypothetical protein VXZ15_00160, partial [Planctomycetota bacterium]|nr:hypothetical protein [Planctomycetota bacterium]